MEPIRIIYRKASELKFAPYNPRQITEHDMAALKRSLTRFGVVDPVIINKDGTVIGGNQRLKALTDLGIEDIPCVELDLDKPHEMALNTALNRIHGEWDNDKLSALLLELKTNTDVDLALTGFTDDEVRMLLDDLPEIFRGPANIRDLKKMNVDKFLMFSRDQIIDSALAYYRAGGFPYPDLEAHEIMQDFNLLIRLPIDQCRKSNIGNRIPNKYHHQRFHHTAKNMKTPYDGFMDDKTLRRAINLLVEGGRISTGYLSVIEKCLGTQGLNNFRPGYSRYIYETYGKPGGITLDSSMGYGGRLVGFIASSMRKYIGVDPSTESFKGNMELAHDWAGVKETQFYGVPFEDLVVKDAEWAGSVDLVFTSPPYFNKEIYSEEATQSCIRYPDYGDWISGFLRPMLQNSWDALRKGGNLVIKIEDIKVGSAHYELFEPAVRIAKDIGFFPVTTDKYELHNKTFRNAEGKKESETRADRVFIMRRD